MSAVLNHQSITKTVPPLALVEKSPELQGTVTEHATIRTATHAQMVRSERYNVRRKKEKSPLSIEILTALIASQGLMQNLVGFEQTKNGKPTGLIEIVAGGRRLMAIGINIDRGVLPEDFQIPYLLITEHEAIASSLAENSGREPMHPADEFVAMQALINEGKSIDDVAASFGIAPLTVKRRLKLANVAPRFLEMYRDEKIQLDQLMALALTDDQALQEKLWDGASQWDRSASCLRQKLTAEEINAASDPVAKFVGIAAYEKAGGAVRRDLFSDEDNCYLQNAVLLEELAINKLDKAAEVVRKEGFAWVEVRLRFDYSEKSQYGRVGTVRRKPTEEETAKIDALQSGIAVLDDTLAELEEDEDDYAAKDTQRCQLEEQLETLEKSLLQPNPEELAHSGVVVYVEHNGKPQILRGLIRPEDKRKPGRIQSDSTCDEAQAGTAKTKPIHSDRLTRQLTAHRTAALQAVLATRPDVALVALTCQLVMKEFRPHESVHDEIVQVSARKESLQNSARDIEQSEAWKAVQEQRVFWESRLPRSHEQSDGQSMFAWLLEQPQADVLALLAFCTACSLNAVQSREKASPAFVELAQSVELDMAEWWKPGKESYLAHVPKKRILAVVEKTVSKAAAVPMEKMKKEQLIDAAEREGGSVRVSDSVMRDLHGQ